jgi:hypothetical protein
MFWLTLQSNKVIADNENLERGEVQKFTHVVQFSESKTVVVLHKVQMNKYF